MTLGERIGRRIRDIRVSRGMTQEQLARKIGSGRAHICRLELGYSTPSVSTLTNLASGLGAGVSELLGVPAEEMSEWLAIVSKLSEPERQYLLASAQALAEASVKERREIQKKIVYGAS